jgi:adenylate cyclase
VPLEIVKELMAKGEVARIGGHTETLTVLFTDIAGFTNISEAMSPEALTNHLAGYFQAMIDALHHHGATVDKIVGDAIVAFWGAPTPMPDQADRALKAVLECQDTLETLNQTWGAQGLPKLPTRFGLATGLVVVAHGVSTRLATQYWGHGEFRQPPGRPGTSFYGTNILAISPPSRPARTVAARATDRIIVAGKTQATDIFEKLGKPALEGETG